MRVLLIENDHELATTPARSLRRQRIAVDTARDAEQARTRAALTPYDVIVFDHDLPGTGGEELCRRLAADGCAGRILMLAPGNSNDNRRGRAGLTADDYLTKPYSFADLLARVRALEQRSRPEPALLVRGDLHLDPARRIATRAGTRLALAPKEFAILELLLAAGGAAVSGDELRAHAWGRAVPARPDTVKVTVSRLRAKLVQPPAAHDRDGARIRLPCLTPR